MKKQRIITIIIILAVIAVSWYFLSGNSQNADEQLAKCIGSKSILYMQEGCIACKKQENIFGDSYKFLNKVDCIHDSTRCLIENITATPTWQINNEKYKGVKTLDELKNMTGC